MKKTTLAVLISSVIMFSGCATTSSTLKFANDNYYGKSLDSLVMKVGAPQSKYVMQSGDIMYKWVYSGMINMPITTFYNSSANAYSYGNTATVYGSGMSTSYGGPSHRVCDMTAITTKNHIIKNIKFNQDTLGTQPATASMCAQMFGIN